MYPRGGSRTNSSPPSRTNPPAASTEESPTKMSPVLPAFARITAFATSSDVADMGCAVPAASTVSTKEVTRKLITCPFEEACKRRSESFHHSHQLSRYSIEELIQKLLRLQLLNPPK